MGAYIPKLFYTPIKMAWLPPSFFRLAKTVIPSCSMLHTPGAINPDEAASPQLA